MRDVGWNDNKYLFGQPKTWNCEMEGVPVRRVESTAYKVSFVDVFVVFVQWKHFEDHVRVGVSTQITDRNIFRFFDLDR